MSEAVGGVASVVTCGAACDGFGRTCAFDWWFLASSRRRICPWGWWRPRGRKILWCRENLAKVTTDEVGSEIRRSWVKVKSGLVTDLFLLVRSGFLLGIVHREVSKNGQNAEDYRARPRVRRVVAIFFAVGDPQEHISRPEMSKCCQPNASVSLLTWKSSKCSSPDCWARKTPPTSQNNKSCQ